MNEKPQNQRVQSRLRIVQWAAWIDLILLVALLASAFTNQRNFVHVLGPLHGINFLLLVVIVATPALDGLWGWWFPLAVFFTGGAPGALVGEWIIKRRIKSSSADNGLDHFDQHPRSDNPLRLSWWQDVMRVCDRRVDQRQPQGIVATRVLSNNADQSNNNEEHV
jgi:hypothetical protein